MSPRVVYNSLTDAGVIGFGCVLPALANNDLSTEISGLTSEQVADSLLVTFPLTDHAVEGFLRVASRRGTYELWVIGSAYRVPDLSRIKDFNPQLRPISLLHLLSDFDAIGALWAFDFECGEIIVIMRRDKISSRVISEILESFGA